METYDEEFYAWWVATFEERFSEWIEQMEKYYEEIESSGVPKFVCL